VIFRAPPKSTHFPTLRPSARDGSACERSHADDGNAHGITIGKMVPGPSTNTAVTSRSAAPPTNVTHPFQIASDGIARLTAAEATAMTIATTAMPVVEFRNQPLLSIVGRSWPAAMKSAACAAANATAPARSKQKYFHGDYGYAGENGG
jgi:hypothetical protein